MSNKSLAKEMMELMLSNYREKNQYSLEDSLLREKEKIVEAAKSSKVSVKDSYSNSLLNIGDSDKSLAFNSYNMFNHTNNYTLWLSLYATSWVFRRAIDKPAQDQVRSGINILGNLNEEQKTKTETMFNKHRKELIELHKWGSLFGGSVGVLMFSDMKDEDYKESLSKTLSKVRSSKSFKIYVTDRWYGCSCDMDKVVSNMKSPDYGKPKLYDITLANGKNLKVHHDYILRYEHRSAPNLIKFGMLQGWGYAEGAHIFNELCRYDKLKSSIQSLIDKALIEVIKMDGMRAIFMSGNDKSKELMEKRLEMVNWARNFNSLTFLDSKDSYEMSGFQGLTGLSNLMEQNMWEISAALDMQGVLYGDLKNGFSNDTEALERYAETILERCEDFTRPIYEKLLYVWYLKEGIKAKVSFEFNSIIKTKLDKDTMEGLNKFKEVLSGMLQDGVITTKQYAQAMRKYQEKGKIDFGFTDETIEGLEDKMEEEMEQIEIEEDEESNKDTNLMKRIQREEKNENK